MIFGEYRQALMRDQAASASEELHTQAMRLRELAKRKRPTRLRARDQKMLDRVTECLHSHIGTRSQLFCPECGRRMCMFPVNGITVDCCAACYSIWLDSGELLRLTGNASDIPGMRLHHRTSRLSCPKCGELMTEYQFCRGENLMVDSCPANHGVYLQDGEFERVLHAHDRLIE